MISGDVHGPVSDFGNDNSGVIANIGNDNCGVIANTVNIVQSNKSEWDIGLQN